MRAFSPLLILALCIVLLASACAGPPPPTASREDADFHGAWRQWGGPHGSFRAVTLPLADSWPEGGPPLLWQRDLGPFVAEDGFGTSPILVGDAVVLSNDQDPGGKSSIVALDRKTGEIRWQVERESKKATFSTPCLFQPEGGRPSTASFRSTLPADAWVSATCWMPPG